MKIVFLATALVAIQLLALCNSFEFRRPRCKQLNPYREPFSNVQVVTRQRASRQEQFLADFAKYMSAKTPQLLREFAMIRKITDPLSHELTEEVEEEQEVKVGAPEDTFRDNKGIRYGPAFEAVPAAHQEPIQPRLFPHPLHKRRYDGRRDIFESGCFPFCRVQWDRNGRQMVEWSEPELREADVTVPRSTTAAPTTTSSTTEASTTTTATTTATSTDVSMTQMPPTTTSASTTTAASTTTSASTLLEQLVQIVLASPQNTSSSLTQLIEQLQQQVAPPTTEATSTTEKPNNNGTILEQLVQVVLTSPENTASAVTQLIQQLQQTFAPTTSAPATTSDATATTDKPANVSAIIESIASLGLGIENSVSEEAWSVLCGPLWWPYHEEHCKEELRCLACSPSVVSATAACKRAKSMGQVDVECVSQTIGDGFCNQCAKKLYN